MNFTPTKAGAYFWIATYNGDANNDAVSGVCGDQGETLGRGQGVADDLDQRDGRHAAGREHP